MKSKFSLIIPAYNEEKRISKTLKVYTDYFDETAKTKKFDYEIIVVINNTKDRTEEIVKEIAQRNKKISYMNFKEKGKGFAVKEGFKDALKRDSELIGFVDADLATPPEAFYFLIENIGSADGAIASRYLRESKITPSFNFRRNFVAKVFNFVVNSLFFLGYNDTQCGAKLFKRKACEAIVREVRMSQWAFDVELLYVLKKRGLKIKELPTTWREVEGGSIKIAKTSLQMFMALVQLRIIKSRLKFLLRPLKPIINRFWRMIQ
jgi:glycosyltransferase involved in cell wall biosynthesis